MRNEMEARLEELEREIIRLKARNEIENLMSRFQYYYTAGMDREIMDELWASDQAGITVEEGCLGVYENREGAFPDGGVSGFFAAAMNIGTPKDYPGKMNLYTNTTQMIEVAGDGKTAKGIWTSIGTETDGGDYSYEGIDPDNDKVSGVKLSMTSRDGKRYQADWVWQKYGVDFLRENGSWKIWHMHIYDVFRCPFDQDWVSFAVSRGDSYTEKLAAERNANPYVKPPGQGTTFYWRYAPDQRPALQPEPPRPYQTYETQRENQEKGEERT